MTSAPEREQVDFAAEGLLDGVDGDERDARLDLLEQLAEAGVPLEELRRAVDEDRLAVLPVEQVLSGDGQYTVEQVAEQARVEIDALRRYMRALGFPDPEPGECRFGDDEVEAAKVIATFRDAGLPDERMLEVARVLGMGLSRAADAMRGAVRESFIRPGDTERDLGLRLVDAAKLFMPALGPMLQIPLEAHMVEIIRAEAIGQVEREQGLLPGARPVAVCFADMVGFTSLAERLEVEELGNVTERFWMLAGEVTNPPVRLVKMIGDEAMLASPDAGALVATSLALIDAAASDDLLPPLRAGAAAGPALRRAGDWYGRPVNLASRITSVAPEGALVVSGELREAVGDTYRWAPAGTRVFKGIEGEVDVYRVEGRA